MKFGSVNLLSLEFECVGTCLPPRTCAEELGRAFYLALYSRTSSERLNLLFELLMMKSDTFRIRIANRVDGPLRENIRITDTGANDMDFEDL